MNILVTGATGFIGYHLCMSLMQSGHIVYATRRPHSNMVIPGINWIDCDLAQNNLEHCVSSKVEVIFHFAQSNQFRNFETGARDVFKVNVDSTFQLLEYARKNKIRQFIYASSGGVYGLDQGKSVDEEASLGVPHSLGFYLTSKYMSELLIDNYIKEFPCVILRIFFPYGINQTQDRLIPRLINKIKMGQEIELEGREGLYINPIYISDLVRVCQDVLNYEESVKFNVGGEEIVSLKQLCSKIGMIVGREPIFRIKNELTSSKVLAGNINLIKNSLSFAPQVSLNDGLRRTIAERQEVSSETEI